jgi:hypothetical protein
MVQLTQQWHLKCSTHLMILCMAFEILVNQLFSACGNTTLSTPQCMSIGRPKWFLNFLFHVLKHLCNAITMEQQSCNAQNHSLNWPNNIILMTLVSLESELWKTYTCYFFPMYNRWMQKFSSKLISLAHSLKI